MKHAQFDYVNQFHCLAGDCPDTCCKDWQIILDEDALARYRAMPGPLGEQVRAALVTENGETRFREEGGRCVLLRDDGLCPIQCAYGEAALCRTCRAHPRFYEEYGATRELTLALSCPAAARSLLAHEAPLRLVETQTDEPVTPNDLAPELYFSLLHVRRALFALAQDRTLALSERMGLILHLAERAQPLLDAKKFSRIDALCADPRPARALALVRRRILADGAFFPCWMVLRNMEHLTAEFPRLLDRVNHAEPPDDFDVRFPAQAENLLVYFLFRYVLKAVNDGRLLPRVESCLFHVVALRYLCGTADAQTVETLQPVVSLYCKEVEHSEENLRLLQRVFEHGTISARYLYTVLRP